LRIPREDSQRVTEVACPRVRAMVCLASNGPAFDGLVPLSGPEDRP
jgi:hypothetical protein